VDTVTWDYTYDQMGRLETVYKDNSLAEAYRQNPWDVSCCLTFFSLESLSQHFAQQ